MRNIFYFIFAFLWLIFNLSCTGPSKEGQISGERIISLSPHITEIIYALDGQDDLIAVTDYCRYPESAKEKEKIGGLIDPNIEKIVGLQPTILFGVPAHEKLNIELTKFGLQIIMLKNESINDVYRTIDSIGVLLNRQEKATSLINGIRDSLINLELSKPDITPTALLVIGRERETLRNITAAGDRTFMNEIWEIAGGQNLFSKLPSLYATVNIESILKGDPDLIIEFDVLAPEGIINKTEDSAWNSLSDLRAVKNRHVFIIGGNYSLIPGPRLIYLAHDFRNIICKFETDSH